MGKCKNKATSLIPWAGKILKGCNEHTNVMQKLADITGNVMEIKSIECEDNCEFNNDLD